MFVKLTKDLQPVDCIENPLFVEWNKTTFTACGEVEAEGIVSGDGEKIYHISGVKSDGRYAHGDVLYETISQEEYAKLKPEIEENNKTFTMAELIAEVHNELE